MMDDTQPGALAGPNTTEGAGLVDFMDTQPSVLPAQSLPIAFTGSGSEYFRIWIVNLLLTLVTFGIYYPWAKVRRLRYFHGNTLVGGEPLGYHANPKAMLKGYALVALMLALYSVAGQFNKVAGVVAFVLVMLIWPALLKSSMQFRLANTSWRGLRLRFSGDLRGAYSALLPMFVPALLIVAGTAFIEDQKNPPVWYGFFMMAVMGATALMLPWLMKRLKDYQHNHYVLATEHTQLHASTGKFYKLGLKMIAIYVAAMAAMGTAAFGMAAVAALATPSLKNANSKTVMMGIVGVTMMIAFLFLFFVLIKPYFTARMQNLVWGNTRSTSIQFHSTLKARSLLSLSIKNWVLVVFTLGLYWPFAAIARLRMQLEAIRLDNHTNLDALVNRAQSKDGEAAGDAAGDLFGLDIGF